MIKPTPEAVTYAGKLYSAAVDGKDLNPGELDLMRELFGMERRIRCAGCFNHIHVSSFAGVKKGDDGPLYYCNSLPCLMELAK